MTSGHNVSLPPFLRARIPEESGGASGESATANEFAAYGGNLDGQAITKGKGLRCRTEAAMVTKENEAESLAA